MVKIAFLLLCHKDPDRVIELARTLAGGGDAVVIHFDGRSPDDAYFRIREALGDLDSIAFTDRRIRCGWGEWSLVEATLASVSTAFTAFPDVTHAYMISAACQPVSSAAALRQVLARGRDHIEAVDFFTSGWIRTGLKRERLVYRHWFNERSQKALFYRSMDLQRRLGLEKRIPGDLRIMIGSQWWCLRRGTLERILALIEERPDIPRFFRTSWVPDETFFQTLVRHLVPDHEVENRSPTLSMFSDYGMPVTFYDDQFGFLIAQDAFFARKISPEAGRLRTALAQRWRSDDPLRQVSREGRAVHRYLTGRGRFGKRFGERIWEREGKLGAERSLTLIVCRKWHIGERMAEAVQRVTGIPAVGYVFDDENATLPDMGGIERGRAKRNRHRRAALRLVYERHRTDRLVMCVDPGNLDLIRDMAADPVAPRILEVRCRYDDGYLRGHAERAGLAGGSTPESVLSALLPVLRREFIEQDNRLGEERLDHHFRVDETANARENAAQFARCFAIDDKTGHALASQTEIFSD